ncbi:tRNA pseudouridine(55) synthase TruB [Zongyangia hominis]|uniref:tRNA pseudouridine synthase B n=1 Tax=Zongyangia hominis TaxID=2763677 RepID=A0A926E9L1_9FIRM|nr:tRNA pseudouridine(55) synthase TruB [Zongyangia hominis]MBC8570440.1 tRNA pseudouridine(55) synthase TruB [Zongyangia hominis]
MDGILCINKPQDFTSFDVVAKLRGILKTRKIGHSGTLDPMATGVLPVLVGTATKACDLLPDQDKGYRVRFRLGLSTDTQDITGRVLSQSDLRPGEAEICRAAESFRGEGMQVPPMYSAVKIGGRKLCDLARQGITVERPARPITVRDIRVLGVEGDEVEMEVFCSKGTYVRTICHDMGRLLGCGGTMTALTRILACGFHLDDCLTLEEVEELMAAGKIEQKLLPVERAFAAYPAVRLSERAFFLFCNGAKLSLDRIACPAAAGDLRVLREDGAFGGLGYRDEEKGELRIRKLFLGEGIL